MSFTVPGIENYPDLIAQMNRELQRVQRDRKCSDCAEERAIRNKYTQLVADRNQVNKAPLVPAARFSP